IRGIRRERGWIIRGSHPSPPFKREGEKQRPPSLLKRGGLGGEIPFDILYFSAKLASPLQPVVWGKSGEKPALTRNSKAPFKGLSLDTQAIEYAQTFFAEREGSNWFDLARRACARLTLV